VLEFRVSRTFSTRAEPTERVAAVAAMFGIGLDEARRFVVLDDVELTVGRGRVLFITGQSGSGKSVLLRCLADHLRASQSKIANPRSKIAHVVDLADIEPPADRALVDCFPQPLDETLRLLSIAGLNDAFLFLRKPTELSDGQRYRLRLALALAAGADVVLIDEFCSTLDRVTARIIAYAVRRYATRTGTTFIVATAHDDLYEDLQPDVYIEKLFGSRIALYEPAPATRPARQQCSVVHGVRIEPAGRTAWKALSALHYRGHALPPHSHIFAATAPSGLRLGDARRIVGVIVYGFPSLANRLRNHATGGRYTGFRGRRAMAQLLNREVRTISRVVVDPQYRGLGLAVRLVRETMPSVGTPYVEALATMARVNPFFERAGMTRYDAPRPAGAERLTAALDHCRIPHAVVGSPAALAARIDQLEPPRRDFLWRELRRWFNRYERAKTSAPPTDDPDTVLRVVARHLFASPVYYLWRNDGLSEPQRRRGRNEHPTSNIQHPTSNDGNSEPGTRNRRWTPTRRG